MNNLELKNYIDTSFITWESIKQQLLASQSVLRGYPITDENIIFSKCIIISPTSSTEPQKFFEYEIQPNEFVVLLSKSIGQNRSELYSIDLTGNEIKICNSNIGQIFIARFYTEYYAFESYSFLLFRIN